MPITSQSNRNSLETTDTFDTFETALILGHADKHDHNEYTNDKTSTTSTSLPKYLRWIVLLLACILLMGNYYCYDTPGALNTQLGDYLDLPYNDWQVKMNSLYTAYSIPNLIMPIICGVLIDSMGTTKMLLAFSLVTFLGQALFSVGIQMKQFWIMALGRSIFGIGGESLEVAQARITTEWFKGSLLGLALGLNLTSARIATSLNDFISPAFENPVLAGWFGGLVCLLSVLSAIMLSFTTRYKRMVAHENDQETEISDQAGSGEDSDDSNETQALLLNNEKPVDEVPVEETSGSSLAAYLCIKDLKKLPLTFWLLCLCAMALYVATNPFIHVLSDLLQKKWYPNDPKFASALMSVPDLISAVGSPLGGFLIDKLSAKRGCYCLKSILLPFSGVLLIATHILIGFTDASPYFALTILGLAYSLFGASLWPLIPHFVTESKVLGTAYGTSTVALNIALAVGPMIVGQLLTHGGYDLVEKYFILLASIGVIIGFIITYLDINNHNDDKRPK